MAKLPQRGCCRKNLFVISLISSSLQWSLVVCMKDVILSANTFSFRCSKTWKSLMQNSNKEHLSQQLSFTTASNKFQKGQILLWRKTVSVSTLCCTFCGFCTTWWVLCSYMKKSRFRLSTKVIARRFLLQHFTPLCDQCLHWPLDRTHSLLWWPSLDEKGL